MAKKEGKGLLLAGLVGGVAYLLFGRKAKASGGGGDLPPPPDEPDKPDVGPPTPPVPTPDNPKPPASSPAPPPIIDPGQLNPLSENAAVEAAVNAWKFGGKSKPSGITLTNWLTNEAMVHNQVNWQSSDRIPQNWDKGDKGITPQTPFGWSAWVDLWKRLNKLVKQHPEVK